MKRRLNKLSLKNGNLGADELSSVIEMNEINYALQTAKTPEEAEAARVAKAIVEVDKFVQKTEYIEVGDEVPGDAALSLEKTLKAEEYQNIKTLMTHMPRAYLREWYMKTVWPNLPTRASLGLPSEMIYDKLYGTYIENKPDNDLVWASFIEVFNQANLEYINLKKLDPWTWENEKLEAFYLSKDQKALDELKSSFQRFTDESLSKDPRAKRILEQFAALPKLGDTGLEVNRQNSIRELLKAQEYAAAQAAVDALRYMSESKFGEGMMKPLSMDITLDTGKTIKKG